MTRVRQVLLFEDKVFFFKTRMTKMTNDNHLFLILTTNLTNLTNQYSFYSCNSWSEKMIFSE